MIFVKSILAGLISLIVAAFLLIIGLLIAGTLIVPRGTAIGIDVGSLMLRSSPQYLAEYRGGPIIVFSLGFFWEYKRVKSRQAK